MDRVIAISLVYYSFSGHRVAWSGYPTVKKTLMICSAVSAEYRRVTDGRTDGQTSFHCIVCAMHTRRAVKTKLKLQLKDDANNNDVFKVRLDKFWAQQEVMFDWTADLTGTGDRSEYTVESY